MKRKSSLLIVAFALLICNTGTAREKILMNFDWKFNVGKTENAQFVKFDDSKWRTLDLAHDFQFEQAWDESAGGARGFKTMSTAWYRKSFVADTAWKGQKILLDFEGIMVYGDVWLNGKNVGATDYGYPGFSCDVTDVLRYDSTNVIAVNASTGT